MKRNALLIFIRDPNSTEAEAFYRDIPTLFGFIIRGFIWDIPILFFLMCLLRALFQASLTLAALIALSLNP